MSYLKLFEDFIQKKDVNSKREISSAPTSEDDEEDEDIEFPEEPPLSVAKSASSASSNNSNVASAAQLVGCHNKMEHSYNRDCTRPCTELTTGLAPARTILVRRPPQCPSCHTHPLEENELDEGNQASVPTYNEINAKEVMHECARIAKYVKNNNPDEDDWESRVNQFDWYPAQRELFAKVVRILDNDQLGRLANASRQNEAMQRRVVVDKSAQRMRKTLASIAWDTRLTQWLHSLLMDSLPSTYMASYLDILQTLKTKLPTLMDKMLFGRPLNITQELLAPVMQRKWEPIITTTKSRKLSHNALFIALPSMATSGPIPARMQKWYHHLAFIAQVVQVTLPMNGTSTGQQSLDQIAEQIVSLTRVKIQEMRNEQPARSIILIGFNAGSALALQVAMSENVACVICMGFAFNTLHGIRGAPDDRILDIKTPILFVVGQNSARTSPEEVESLREKMQSETSLVVVGSADDVMRVPKSRRKIENVTQTMVDTMIIDEVFEFVKKTLNNPPGPRVPTSVTGGLGFPNVSKQGKATFASGLSGEIMKTTPVQRKRKQQDGGEEHSTPAKTKYVTHIGRPRTRPVPGPSSTIKPLLTSTPVGLKGGKTSSQLSPSSITNEDLNMAIQSILGETTEQDSGATANTATILLNNSGGGSDSKKLVTNFELVAQTKTSNLATTTATPIKTTLIQPLKQTLSGANSNNVGAPNIGTKIKMIPANQFVQLKPPMQSQSKIYTIKTSAMLNSSTTATTVGGGGTALGSIVATTPNSVVGSSGQQQIFTLKSPNGQTTQFVTAAAPTQQKFTLLKNVVGGSANTSGGSSANTSSLDLSNIIDMPIIFADSDGNLSDAVSSPTPSLTKTTPTRSSGVGQLIISQQIIKEANSSSGSTGATSGTYVINKSLMSQSTAATTPVAKPNKVVFINRNTMKPCPNIISRSNVAQQLPKYTKVVVTNPKTAATTLVQRAAASTSSSPLVSTVKQLNLQSLKSSSLGVGGAKQLQILNSTNSADKPQIRNIVVKPGGLKQIPPHLKSQLLNRNLTVRKLVNLVPATKTTAMTTTLATAADVTTASTTATVLSTTGANAIQSSPKIITLNPINPSVSTKTTPATTTSSSPSSSD